MSTDLTNIEHTKQHLTIATHNIQGYNTTTKRQLWLDYCISQQLDIISLTETKLAHSQYTHLTLHNNNYKCFMSNNSTTNSQHSRESSAGTILLIKQSLSTYIHNIQTLNGTAIAIDLYLPHKDNLRIISTYLPNDPNTNRQTQNQIILWIIQAQKSNTIPVIIGDFNQDLNRPQRSTLYKYLESYNFIPLIHTYHPHTPTWQCKNLSSQIDEIWVPQQILHTFTTPTITHATGITDSDHHIIHTNLQIHTKPTK